MHNIPAFGVNRGIKQKQGIAPVYKRVGRAAIGGADFGFIVHQRIVGDLLHQAQIEHGLRHAQIGGNPARFFQLDGVALAVLKSDGLDIFAAVSLNRLNQAGGGILAA